MNLYRVLWANDCYDRTRLSLGCLIGIGKNVMEMTPFLIVERGPAYDEGTIISLTNAIIILGRRGETWDPDISFDNAFVSRKHAALYLKDGNAFIKDLNSKHGTFINNVPLISNKKIMLNHQDKISLANNLVVLTFLTQNLDETLDIGPFLKEIENRRSVNYQLDPVKQILTIDSMVTSFTEKEFICIEYLIENKGQFVSKDQLKERIWSERILAEGTTPDVNQEELNALIYRIRKKVHGTISIESIRGKGYVLSMENKKND